MFVVIYRRGDRRDLLSFPTRRSSDLSAQALSWSHRSWRGPSSAPSWERRSLSPPSSRRGERPRGEGRGGADRKSTCLNSSHGYISYAVFCLQKKNFPFGDRRR